MKLLIFMTIIGGIFGAGMTPEKPDVKFLKAVNRHNNTDFTDYFFKCELNGTILQWEYNSTPLPAFVFNQVGKGSVTLRQNYNVTTVLLSAQPAQNNTIIMQSILMLSFNGGTTLNFNVSCNNSSLSGTVPAGNITNVEHSNVKGIEESGSDGIIILDSLTIGEVADANVSILMCGSDSPSHELQYNNNTILLQSNNRGAPMKVFRNEYSLNMFGIVIDSSPHQTESVFIVPFSHDGDNVSCSYGSTRVTLQLNLRLTTADTTGEVPDPSISSETRANGTTSYYKTTTIQAEGSNGQRTVETVVRVVVLFLIIIFLALLCIIISILTIKRKNRMKKQGDSSNCEVINDSRRSVKKYAAKFPASVVQCGTCCLNNNQDNVSSTRGIEFNKRNKKSRGGNIGPSAHHGRKKLKMPSKTFGEMETETLTRRRNLTVK